jgi:hypothetical protein
MDIPAPSAPAVSADGRRRGIGEASQGWVKSHGMNWSESCSIYYKCVQQWSINGPTQL